MPERICLYISANPNLRLNRYINKYLLSILASYNACKLNATQLYITIVLTSILRHVRKCEINRRLTLLLHSVHAIQAHRAIVECDQEGWFNLLQYKMCWLSWFVIISIVLILLFEVSSECFTEKSEEYEKVVDNYEKAVFKTGDEFSETSVFPVKFKISQMLKPLKKLTKSE